jgi:hypothetical protein
MRHPERRFPGVLIQGDTLRTLCGQAEAICAGAKQHLDEETYEEFNDLRNRLWEYLSHHKVLLGAHGIPLPFNETP